MTTKLITHEPEGDFSYFQNLLCLFVPFNSKESIYRMVTVLELSRMGSNKCNYLYLLGQYIFKEFLLFFFPRFFSWPCKVFNWLSSLKVNMIWRLLKTFVEIISWITFNVNNFQCCEHFSRKYFYTFANNHLQQPRSSSSDSFSFNSCSNFACCFWILSRDDLSNFFSSLD